MSAVEKLLEFDRVFEEGEDKTPEDKALELKEDAELTVRVGQALNWVKYRELELKAAKARVEPLIEELESEIKFHTQRLEYAQKVLTFLFPPGPDSTFANDYVSAYYSPSFETEVFDTESIPIEYTKFIEPTPDKRKIKEALQKGADIPGARIVINYNLKIGAGGKRGEHNRAQREKKRQEREVEHPKVEES